LDLGTRKFDFSNVSVYGNWRELVADPNIEAVTICLPTDLHAEVTIAALQAGKHVLCEKPMALTAAECDRMIAEAADAGRTLMIAQVLRFWPEYVALHEFVSQSGPVRKATFIRKCGVPVWSKWLPNQTLSGGAVLDLLVHDIDQILLLCGMPDRVTAKQLGDGDAMMASFIYPGGPEVRLQGGWFAPETPFSMSFQVRTDHGELELTHDGLMLSDSKGVRKRMELAPGNGYAEEVHYFLDCCLTGEPPLKCMPQDSAKAVKVALALKESRAKDGEQIKC
jgi:predicted dehydrogenase